MNTNPNSTRPLEWFENRIGMVIFRPPLFDLERAHDAIPVKIKNKDHAKTLFDLQKPGRPPYADRKEDVQLQTATR